MTRLIRRRALAAGAAALAIAAFAAWFVSASQTRVTFVLEDAFSKGAVWDAAITIQGRQVRSFYQSNVGPVPMTITHLRPGRSTITVTAPAYRSLSIPVRLLPGGNLLPRPIEMTGIEIPGLDRFVMVERSAESGVRVQLRPVAADGLAIRNHPCLDLRVGAVVSAQVRGAAVDQKPGEAGVARGTVLFAGYVPWSWDASPSADFRYSVMIPFEKLSRKDVPLLVVDYLVIVPDPTHTNSPGMAGAPSLADPAALRSFLERARSEDGLRYFVSTSWNVKGPA